MQADRRLLLCSLFALAPTLAGAHPAVPEDAASVVSQQLRIAGRVKEALTLVPDNLAGFAPQALPETPVRSRTGATLRLLQGYAGIRLTDLLERAQLLAADHNDLKKTILVATAGDGYKAVFSWNELFNTAVGAGVHVLCARDGQPLGDAEGRFALISLQDIHTGPRHVRWLTEVRAELPT